MDKKLRADVVRAMDLISRSINDEEVGMAWLVYGVADGDIDNETTDEELEDYYNDDDEFGELMDTFLCVMKEAKKSGGLYVDGVVSK